MLILEDVTEYLTSENLTETANDLLKVLSNVRSTCLAESQTKSVNTNIVIAVFKWIQCRGCFNNNIYLLWDHDKWSRGLFKMNVLLLKKINNVFSRKTVWILGFHVT